MDIDKDNSYDNDNENVSEKAIVNSNKIKIPLLDPIDMENNGENDHQKEEKSFIESSKDESMEKENVSKKQEEDYDLNKDWKFLSILQFVNVFHNVLSIDNISTYELEFSLKHSDIEPLCMNILYKLLMKKEVHRATASSTAKNEANANNTTQGSNNQNPNNQNPPQNNPNNAINNSNPTTIPTINNITSSSANIASTGNSGNQQNCDINKLNELLIKKINFFYKTYVRYLKKAYSVPDMNTILDIINQDVTQYRTKSDPFAFTPSNMSDKFFDDLDTKTYLIVEFFRDLGGINPLVKDLSSQRMEALMSNHQEEDKNEINEDFYSFSELSVKHKVKVLFFFCNYCMTFSGRMPLYKEEINKSKEETIVLNKRIAPFFSTKDGTDYYTFPLNKDCRIYKEQLSLLSPIKSNEETFSICVSNYAELEKLIESETNQQLVKKVKDKLIQFKSNDEEEKKKEQNLLRKQELFEKAKKLSTMNTNNISEVEKYKNNDFLLMNISNHVITRNQLNQIAKINQQTIHSSQMKTHELTEEEKHKMKIERENLERERRMEKRNRLQEKRAMEEKYKLEHSSFNGKKRNRDKKSSKKGHRKKWKDDDEEESCTSSSNLSEDETPVQLDSDSDENYEGKKTKKDRNNVDSNTTYLRNQPKPTYKDDINTVNTNRNTVYIDTSNDPEPEPVQASDIINEGYLIYRYSSNQIEIEGNWYVANDPLIKERISYLFSGSNQVRDVHLTLNNMNNITPEGGETETEGASNPPGTTDIEVKLCSANLFECITIDPLLKSCLEFLNGEYAGYFMYYGKTIEDRLKLTMEIEDSLVKCFGDGINNLGTFNLIGYMNFFRSKEVILEKNKVEESYIKLAEFKMTKIYNEFKYEENDRVIKSYNHRRKKNTDTSDYYEY